MIALISFIIVMVGAINWFCIGLLQFDFVAGLFGSQASIFSRIVYVAVGLASLILIYTLIENKGKIVFNFKKKIASQSSLDNKFNLNNQVEAGKDAKSDSSKNNNAQSKNNNTKENTKENDLNSNNSTKDNLLKKNENNTNSNCDCNNENCNCDK